LSQAVLPAGNPDLTLPRWIMWCGAGTGLLLVTAVRMLFPPLADRPQGATGPAFWLQQASESVSLSPCAMRVLKAAGMIAAAALLGALAGYQPVFLPQFLVLAAVLVAAYQVRRWRL
jgi:small neutral amino acid transporter SnatA (MarC family)